MALHGARRAREDGMGRGFASFLLAEAANRCTRLGRLAEADDLTRRALDYGPGGISAGLAPLRSRQRAPGARSAQTRRAPHLVEAKRLLRQATPRCGSPRYIRPLGRACGYSMKHRPGPPLHRRGPSAHGGREEYAFYVSSSNDDVASRADAAQRLAQPGRGTEELLAARERRWRTVSPRGGCRGRCLEARRPRCWPTSTRGGGGIAPRRGPDPSCGRGDEANERIANRITAAYSSMREAEAIIESGGDRDKQRRPSSGSRVAGDCGAEPLREACEGLARSAPASTWPANPSPGGGSDPFGLTPRERDVLDLWPPAHQPPDRPSAVHEREDRERARFSNPGQARGDLPRRGGRSGTQAGARRRLEFDACRPGLRRARVVCQFRKGICDQSCVPGSSTPPSTSPASSSRPSLLGSAAAMCAREGGGPAGL